MALVTDKCIFIHVQKTGGMSVRQAMHSCTGGAHESGPIESERHIGLPELLVAHPGIDTGRLVFGFVRHPLTWLSSRYHFARESGFEVQRKHRPSAAALWISSCWAPTFSEFIERYLERFPGVATQEMYRRLGLWSGRPADRVGRLETLADDLPAYLAEAGETFDAAKVRAMQPVNTTTRTGDQYIRLPEATVNAVLQAERSLVERFYSDSGACSPYLVAHRR